MYSRLDLRDLKCNILKTLRRQGYIITDEKEKTISFKVDNFAIASTITSYKQVDGGIFNIYNSQENYMVEYTYLVSLFGPIYLISLAIFLSLVVIGNSYGLLSVVPAILQFMFRISSLKSTSKDLLSEILLESNVETQKE